MYLSKMSNYVNFNVKYPEVQRKFYCKEISKVFRESRYFNAFIV